jgi:tetratricopeptide (TPR) repeat protein
MILPALVAFVMFVSLLGAASRAGAQTTDAKAAARARFQKGVAAFDDRRYAEAADEFEAAYRLSPAFVVLYNIGQVDVILGRSVEAVDAFDKYLKQGAAAIPAERRREVEAEIEKQTARIGTIAARTIPDGAELRVDGALVGTTPLPKVVRVTAGHHTVAATMKGRTTEVREVDVGGRAEIALELTLAAISAETPAAAPVAAPAPPPPAPPVIEMPVVEKTVIERTYVETQTPSPDRTVVERSAPRASSSAGTVQRVVGYTLVAAGLAGATTGGVLAFQGANRSNDAKDRLSTAGLTDDEWNAAMADFDAGKKRNETGWIVAGIGAAVLVGGIIVVATTPERTNAVAIAPWVTAQSGGLAMSGAW